MADICGVLLRKKQKNHLLTTNHISLVLQQLRVGVGVYISRIEEGSLAERAGLRPGDTILEVNGTPFTSISHEEALKVTSAAGCQVFTVGGWRRRRRR